MYSWFLGDQQDFKNDPEAMLLGVKSLLPRWMNGIPDAQFMDIFYSAAEAIENFDQKKISIQFYVRLESVHLP